MIQLVFFGFLYGFEEFFKGFVWSCNGFVKVCCCTVVSRFSRVYNG